MTERCYQAADLQRILGVSQGTAYNLLHRADFPKIKLGRRYVVPVAAFERWLLREAGETLEEERPLHLTQGR